jgi:uncharacterized protein (DUF1684 family)
VKVRRKLLIYWNKFQPFLYRVMTVVFLAVVFYHCNDSKQISKEEAAYIAEIEAWHAKRIQALTSKTGWLSLSGLYWLKEGENTYGSNPANDIKFPAGRSPEYIGSIYLQKGKIWTEIDNDVNVLVEDQKIATMEMDPDISGKPTILTLDSLSWFVIQRGDRYGIRLRDRESPYRRNFEGIENYAINIAWRIPAKLESYHPPKKIEVPNILGTVSEETTPGALVFTIDNIKYQLDPIAEPGDKKLFIIFADKTNNDETYGAGRFLYVEMPGEDGQTTIDFNEAYNPPCAFTPFATCLLPPAQNILPIKITAGEKKYGDH